MDPENTDLEPQGGSPNNPAGAPNGNGENKEDIASLPEWAQSRLKGAEGAISELKTVTGAKSVKEIKEKFEKSKPGQPTPPKPEDHDGSRTVTHDELAAFQQGFTPEEIGVARSIKPGVKLGDALTDPTVKAAINGIRKERQTNEHIPEPTTRIPVIGNRSFSDLKPEERKANYGKTFDALVQKGRGRGGRNVGS